MLDPEPHSVAYPSTNPVDPGAIFCPDDPGAISCPDPERPNVQRLPAIGTAGDRALRGRYRARRFRQRHLDRRWKLPGGVQHRTACFGVQNCMAFTYAAADASECVLYTLARPHYSSSSPLLAAATTS